MSEIFVYMGKRRGTLDTFSYTPDTAWVYCWRNTDWQWLEHNGVFHGWVTGKDDAVTVISTLHGEENV